MRRRGEELGEGGGQRREGTEKCGEWCGGGGRRERG